MMPPQEFDDYIDEEEEESFAELSDEDSFCCGSYNDDDDDDEDDNERDECDDEDDEDSGHGFTMIPEPHEEASVLFVGEDATESTWSPEALEEVGMPTSTPTLTVMTKVHIIPHDAKNGAWDDSFDGSESMMETLFS